MSSASRLAIIDTAVAMFHHKGFHCTEVDDIARAVGMERAGLEQLFATKECLMLAALERRDARFREALQQFIDRTGSDPRTRILAVFDFLEEWFEGPALHGYLFINSSHSFCDPADPVRRAASLHKQALYDQVLSLTREAVPTGADALSCQLLFLIEGEIVTRQVSGRHSGSNSARAAAEALVLNAIRTDEKHGRSRVTPES